MLNRKEKLIVTLFLFVCIFLSISFASANDNSVGEDYNQTYENSTISHNCYNKSFMDLDNEINANLNKSEIMLNEDYFHQINDNFKNGIIIDRTVTIDGQGHTIDANHSSKIFLINADNVVLKNIKFLNGYNYNNHDLSDNYHRFFNGGAIYCNATNMTIINSIFINNIAPLGHGGAIYVEGSTGKIINSTFIYNIADLKGAAIYYKYGGNIINSTFIYNKAFIGIENYESIYYDYENYNVLIINSIFINNTVLEPDNRLMYKEIDNISPKIKNLKVKKTSPKFIAKNKIFNKKSKTKKYSLTLKNNKGKPLRKAFVSLKIKGKIFKTKTNKNGKATFKITKINKKGRYNVLLKYYGNEYYKSIQKIIKIILK